MTIALPQQNIKMDVLTGIDPVWYDKLKALTDAVNLLAGTSALLSSSPIHASLGADVLLNNTANYFDGPSIAQGTTGTWWVSGSVTLLDLTGAANMICKLWDGTTVIDSGTATVPGANLFTCIALSGFITSPSGNLKISCRDIASTTGKIVFNATANSKDSTISAFRIA